MKIHMFKSKQGLKVVKVFGFSLLTGVMLAGCLGGGSSGGGGGGLGGDSAGTLQLSATSYAVAEGTSTVTVTINRSGGTSGAVSVDYATADSTATSGSDYTAISTTTLNWADGDSAAKTFDVTIADDSDVELTEALTVNLSNVSGATLGSNSSASVSITDNDSIAVSGTIYSPTTDLAFQEPSFTDRMLASLFGKRVNAAIGDFASAVPAGVTVNVYEIDATGALVSGTPITTATTDSFGAYVLAAPLDAPASKYIIRAESGVNTLESRITAATVDVDPVTDATSLLVVYAASDLNTISVDEITQIGDEVGDLVEDIDSADTTTASALSTALDTAAKADQEVDNVVTSTAAAGSICGTVTRSGDTAALANIRMVVKDYGEWVTRAKTLTASDGTYCMNVPDGDYIVGAFNRTGDTKDAQRSASEWYNSGLANGGAYPVNGEKITVAGGGAVNGIDFDLDPGIRITGSVVGSGGSLDGAAMEGAKVQIRDTDTNFPVAAARVKADGTYRVNVRQGKYTIQVRNRSQKPYASQYAVDTGNEAGDHNLGYAKVYDLTAKPTPGGQTVDFSLLPGNKLTGTITESAAPITGTLVLVDDPTLGGANARLRTNKNGQFRIWLKPNTYDVLAYGQTDLGIDLTGTPGSGVNDSHATSFTADVAKQPITLLSGTTPVSEAKVLIYDSADNYIGRQVTVDDGTTTLYSAAAAGNHKIVVRIDDAQSYGSVVYDGNTRYSDATGIALDPAVTTPLTSFDVALPDAGVLKVIVQDNSTNKNPQPNIPVQVRDDNDPGDTNANNGTNKFTTARTRGDGTSILSLPGGTVGTPWIYDNVRVNGSAPGGNCLNVNIVNGYTTTLTVYTDLQDGTAAGCTVGAPTP